MPIIITISTLIMSGNAIGQVPMLYLLIILIKTDDMGMIYNDI